MAEPDGKVVIKTEVDNSGVASGLEQTKKIADTAVKEIEATEKKTTFGDTLKAKASEAGSAIKTKLGEIKTSIGDNLTKGIGLVTDAASIALGKFTINGVKMASDLNEVQNVVDTTFGKSAASVNEFAKNAGQAYGLTELSALQMNGTMGAMLKSMGIGSGDVTKMSTSIAGLSGDMASFYNLDSKDAFEKIRSGISGETEPLKELGINMSEANLSAFALAQGLKKPYDQMSAAEQVQVRYNFLMNATKDAQGDFSKTSDSFANQQRIATLETESLSASFGKSLLPVISQGTKFLLEFLTPLLNFLSANPAVLGAIIAITAAAAVLSGGLSILTTVTTALGIATESVIWPVALVVAAIVALIAVAAVVVSNWGAISGFFVNLWAQIVGAFNAAIAAIQAAWASVVEFFNGVWAGIQAIFSGVGAWFVQVFTDAWVGIQAAWASVTEFFTSLWAGIQAVWMAIPGFFAGLWAGVVAGVTTFLAPILAVISGIFAQVSAVVLSIWAPIQAGLLAAWAGIQAVAAGAWEIIKNVILAPVLLLIDLVTGNFGQMGTDMAKIWDNIQAACAVVWAGIVAIFTGVWAAISGGVLAFGNLIVSFLASVWASVTGTLISVWNAIPGFFSGLWASITNGLKSAWNAVAAFFVGLWNGIGALITSAWNGFWGIINTVTKTIHDGVIAAFNAVIDWFKALPGSLYTIGSDMFNRMKDGVMSTIGFVVDAVKTGIGKAIDWVKALPGEALQWGKDIINGIVDGIKAAAFAVGDAVKGVAQNIRSFLHFSVPDQGPLSDFDTYAPDMMKLWGQGLSANADFVLNPVKAIAQGVSDTASGSGAAGLISGAIQNTGAAASSVSNRSTVVTVEAPMQFSGDGYSSRDGDAILEILNRALGSKLG